MLELWFDQDLNEPVSVRTVSGNIFHQDAGGNKIGVRVTKDGASYALSSGMVTGYVIRADGTTITISGTPQRKHGVYHPAGDGLQREGPDSDRDQAHPGQRDRDAGGHAEQRACCVTKKTEKDGEEYGTD